MSKTEHIMSRQRCEKATTTFRTRGKNNKLSYMSGRLDLGKMSYIHSTKSSTSQKPCKQNAKQQVTKYTTKVNETN